MYVVHAFPSTPIPLNATLHLQTAQTNQTTLPNDQTISFRVSLAPHTLIHTHTPNRNVQIVFENEQVFQFVDH